MRLEPQVSMGGHCLHHKHGGVTYLNCQEPKGSRVGWISEERAVPALLPDPGVETLPPGHPAQLPFISFTARWPFARVMLTYLSPGVLLSLVRLHLPTPSTGPGTGSQEDLAGPGAHSGARRQVAFLAPPPGAPLPTAVLRPELAGERGYSPRGSPVEGRC